MFPHDLIAQWLLQVAPHLAPLMPELSPLLQLGGAGALLVWLLLKAEPRLKGIEAAIDRLARVHLLAVLAVEQLSGALKAEAQKLLEEIHDSEKARERD
jgi:hypothetical protein